MHPEWIVPEWPAPASVQAVMTTRHGGTSLVPFDAMNTATHVGDDPLAVQRNRHILGRWLPAEPVWLNQVHGIAVANADACHPVPPDADASVARWPEQVCVVQTADCLPVLFCDVRGCVVAAAHAGWRGLAAGVLEATVQAMHTPPQEILAWMGAAIGPDHFEVGEEVRSVFVGQHPQAARAFRPSQGHKWLADIYCLARIHLEAAGVKQIWGGGLCSYRDAERFYSYRRERQTGRMSSLIWLRDSS